MAQQQFSPERLRAARLAAGLSREQAAVGVGRSFQSIQSYEQGRVSPPLEVVGRLAALYEVEVADLFDWAMAVAG